MRQIEASIRALVGLSTFTVVYTGVLFENATPATIGDNRVAVPSTKALAVSVDEVERRLESRRVPLPSAAALQ